MKANCTATSAMKKSSPPTKEGNEMKIKVPGQRRTYKCYKTDWVSGVSLSEPNGSDNRPPCNYKFGSEDFWGEQDGKVYYATYTRTIGPPSIQSRAMNLMQRMNEGLSKEEWTGHWIYTLAQEIFWREHLKKAT